MADPKPNRRWLRFSLRTLLLIVAVFGVLFGWIGSAALKVRQRQAYERRFDMDEIGGLQRIRLPPEEPKPPLLWTVFGARPYCKLSLSREKYTEDEIRQIITLFPEADIFVTDHHNYTLPPVQWGAGSTPPTYFPATK